MARSAVRHVWATLLTLAAVHAGAAQLGDAGHYLTLQPDISVLNPDGRAWSFTLHRFPWWIGGGWNRSDFAVQVRAPDGTTAFTQTVEVVDQATVPVPAGKPGTWRIDVDARNGLNFWYLESTLDHAVVSVRPRETYDLAPTFCFNPFVPRTWCFWVPPGTERFRIKALNVRGRSHREDHGLTVFSPRGQRMAVLWGQANPDAPKSFRIGKESFAIQEAEIIVENGSAGRFWGLEVRMGDSHTYSDVNLILEGVPPFLAQRPEVWFDADSGKTPVIPLYDETEFVQSDRTPGSGGVIQNWTPCPALGDLDGCELRCPTHIALWNPDNRPLKLVVGTYLPRHMFPEEGKDEKGRWKGLPDERHEHAVVKVTGAAGGVLLDRRVPLLHLHGGERWQTNLVTGAGVAHLEVTGAEHFWAYTYPATPAVLVGAPAGDGWKRFLFEIGTARHWYFQVPVGTTRFQARFAAASPTDIVEFSVNAPDRKLAAVYGNRGECTVDVPPGLDGALWHLRADFGSATRFETGAANPRFPSLVLTVDLKGVPPYLAPTREQWFDPDVTGVGP